ncbi:MAG: HK97 family phage prohead protease [Candidatus Competibacteraceae bacterium]|nr:HK97 family phage prohead protease [Candidatus Competibacteraceae bacterium]
MTVVTTDSRTRDLRAQTHYRTLEIDRAVASPDDRTVPASLSSEIEVSRWFGREVLIHDADSIVMDRARDGLPLIWNHNSDVPIGLVENLRLEDKKLRGVLRFSRNPKAEEVWIDVQDGMLRNISIGYRILEWVESTDSDLVRVIKWELCEASIAPVPADHTVGINRSQDLPKLHSREAERVTTQETSPMTDEITPVAAEPSPVADIVQIRREHEIVAAQARKDAIASERKRTADVSAVFDLSVIPRIPEMQALRAKALDEGWSADQTREVVLRSLQSLSQPVADHSRTTDDDMGIHHDAPVQQQTRASTRVDALDKFKQGVSEAFVVRAGLDSSREAVTKARQGGFIGVRLSRMAEHYLQLVGVDTRGLSDDQISQRALVTRASGMTTSDFANLLVNTANKALLLGWEQAPETWQLWTRIGQVPDFKQATRTGLSGFSALAVVPEDGEITYGKFTDRKETIQAVSYAKKFRLTYQAIKNDDLNAFTAIPRGMGRAAQGIIGDVVYALLDGVGPTLNQDSTAMFDTAGHSNYVAAATAPNVTTLDTAFTAMAKQTDPNSGKALNITPRYLLVPKALETTGRVLNTSMYDPAASPGSTSGKNIMAPNPFQNRLEVISDARLDGQTNGTAAWYLAADPNRFDTVEVAFVDGVAEPYLREEQEWDTRGVEWVVGVDFGVAALDYRGLHKYKGNT